MDKITFVDELEIKNKKILLRVDFNVSLNPDFSIADDTRIKQSLTTINHLLKNQNKLIIVSHLGRPTGRDIKFSMKPAINDLQKYLTDYKVNLIDDFLTPSSKQLFSNQNTQEILFLENIRFYPEDKSNDPQFAKKLSSLADVFVNDAFAVCHRSESSIVGVTSFIPSYGGLLLKKEIVTISKAVKNPKKPFVAIIGGAKISSKIGLLNKLIEIADDLIVGGALANTFLLAQGFKIGKSLADKDNLDSIRRLFFLAAEKHTVVHLPVDVIVGKHDGNETSVKKVEDIPNDLEILDVGPVSLARFGSLVSKAKTIVWNGPLGYTENPVFRRGTDFIFYAIAENSEAISIVGGGDTITAISKEEYLGKITHISTGGGAMLEFIEKGTLPGIEALKR